MSMNAGFNLDFADLFDTSGPSPLAEIERIEQEEKDERKQERLEFCGTWSQTLNATTGEPYSFRSRCHYWRDCSRCFEERVEAFQSRYRACKADTEDGEYLQAAELSDLQAKRLIRRLRKTHSPYWRIPTEDGILILWDNLLDSTSTGTLDHSTIDWEVLARTPEKTKYTGKLGRIENKKEKEEGSIVVRVPQVHAIGCDTEKAMGAAMDGTSYLTPEFDIDAIGYALWLRMEVFKEKVVEMGGKVLYETTRWSRVSPSIYNRWKIERVEPLETPEEPPMDYEQAISDLFIEDYVEKLPISP